MKLRPVATVPVRHGDQEKILRTGRDRFERDGKREGGKERLVRPVATEDVHTISKRD
jgi:hypothetical protein